MTVDLQRCRDEQVKFATLLLASGSLQNPPTSYQFGLRMAATDAFTEDLLNDGLWDAYDEDPAELCRRCNDWPCCCNREDDDDFLFDGASRNAAY